LKRTVAGSGMNLRDVGLVPTSDIRRIGSCE
jgi:hypothetical protein